MKSDLNKLLLLLLFVATSVQAAEPLVAEFRNAGNSLGGMTTRRYILRPNDKLQLSVYDEPDLQITVMVDQNGNATFPLIETVPVGGKTVEEASRTIRELLAKDYLVDPKVTLMVSQPAKQTFNILGHAKTAGPYEIVGTESITLVEAISMAGGAAADGNLQKVIVTRQLEGQPNKVYKDLNAKEMLSNKNAPAFQVFPGDTIYIPPKAF